MTLLLDRQAHKLTSGNGLSLATGVLCVAGVSPYYSPSTGKIVWRFRHPDMLKRSAHLYTNTVILDEHPEALAAKYPRDRVVGGVGIADWDPAELQITGQLMLYDTDAVLENGYFSHGILARCTPKSGTWRGIRFDEEIEIDEVNHIASTSQPRQGDRVRLLLDSADGGGDYLIDPDSLGIVVPPSVTFNVPDPEPKPEPDAVPIDGDGGTLDPPIDEKTEDETSMTPEDMTALQSSIDTALAPIRDAMDKFAIAITALAEATVGSTPEETPPEPINLADGVLKDALAIQAAALPLQIVCDGLDDQENWDGIVKAVETAVGFGEDWDPTGMSIANRLAACRALSAKTPVAPVVVVDSVDLPPVPKPAPPAIASIPGIIPSVSTIRFI